MFQHFTDIRISYADTDQMGFVYYGNYAKFFEIGRVEAIRSLGMTYKSIELDHKIMPVADLQVKYIKPALYDDIITIETNILEFPEKYKIHFQHKVWNAEKILLVKGNIRLYILDKNTLQPSTFPDVLLQRLNSYFQAK